MEGLLKVSGCEDPTRVADMIFIHGLHGDANTTWHPRDKPEDFPKVGVWSLGYAVSASAWKGHGMPLYDRAHWTLTVFEQNDIGQRPLGFVCRNQGSLGGSGTPRASGRRLISVGRVTDSRQ